MYLAKSGCHYVKAIDGKPVFRSTQAIGEAARFATEEEARAFAGNVFAKGMLSALVVVSETAADRSAGRVAPISRLEEFNDEPNMPWDHHMGR